MKSKHFLVGISSLLLLLGAIPATHAQSSGGGASSGSMPATPATPVPPAITSQIPVNGALGVATTSTVTVVFDRNITATTTNISFSPTTAFTFATSSNILTITPSAPLSNNTTYTLTLAGIKDTNGLVLSSYTSQFTTANDYSISVYNNANGGLNLISLPVQPANTAIASVLGSAASSIDSVWSYDPSNSSAPSSGWLVYYPAHPELSSLSTMNTGYGYWVTANTNTTLSGSGSLFTSTSTPPSRAVQSGWNLLGYYQLPGQNSSTATNAFSSISGYTTVVGYDNQTGVFKTVSSILPGDAFWLGTPTSGTYYPSYSFSSSSGGGTFGAPQEPGTVSVTRASDSPSANVLVGASSVKWASFEMTASNEDVKVDNLNVYADSSVSNGGLDNGKVFVNGVQVGSTKDITETATNTNFTFGSSFIVRVGTTAVVDIYADAKTSTSTNLTANETVRIYLGVGSSNALGQVSLSSINVPTGDVTGNAITVVASSLSATKASYYGNQTVIAGAQNVKIGAFTLSAGSMEGINVNTIEIDFASAISSTISDLVLKDHDTSVQYGSNKATVSMTNSFSGSMTIAASGTKTFDIYANIKTGANAGIIPVRSVSTNTTGTGAITGSSVSVGTAATLQTITVGNANLTVAQNAGSTPDNANVIAGSSMVKVGSFRFTSQYSPYTVDQFKVKIPANAATAVSAVVVQYKDSAGSTQTATQALTLSSGAQTHSTATFTGLTFYIPSDSNGDLGVYVNVSTGTSVPGTSGKSITVILDANEGFHATDSSGTVDDELASADIASSDTSGKGTMTLRKSYPTLAAGTAPSATLSAGSDQVLGTFNVTADSAGDVDWGQVVFTVNKTAAVTIGATTTLKVWDVTSGTAQVAGTFATTSATDLAGGLDSLVNLTSGSLHFRPDTVQTVGAGTTRKYELRGTVGGIAAGSNNLSVSIATPSTAVTTSAFAAAAGTLGTAGNASFVWSDWSDATNHATNALTATDWTSDYLVKTLPLTIGNRSVSI